MFRALLAWSFVAQERLILSWGKTVADQKDLPSFIHDLTSLETVLVPDRSAPQGAPPAILRFSNRVTALTASSMGKIGLEIRSSPPLRTLRARLSKSE